MTNRIAIIGSGLSGLTCARVLQSRGFEISVFEKSRGPGGRMSTRRTSDGLSFDHGAQYFTARDPLFQSQVQQWCQAGCVAKWEAKVVSLQGGRILEDRSDRERFVGTPGMNAVGKHLAQGLPIQYEIQVDDLKKSGDGWQLSDKDGTELGRFGDVVVTAPSLQTSQIVAADKELSNLSQQATMQGCWSVMVAFDSSLNQEFGGAFVQDSPLSWISWNSSKPGRLENPECWVLHASPDWTEKNFEVPVETVGKQLMTAFRQAVGIDQLPQHTWVAHRWRYAIPTHPLTERYVYAPDSRLGLCGDWCGGPRVEGAFLSGHALGTAIANGLTQAHVRGTGT